jgi:RNA polymerase sigma-70 factor (ECF subfamily)
VWDDPRRADDAALLAAAADGDREAFGAFYDRHVRAVLALCWRRTADAQVAADLCAETFAAALLSVGRFRPDAGAPRAWLFGIAGHQVSRWRRRQRVDDRARRRLGLERIELDDASTAGIEALSDVVEYREAVRAAMATLSPALREAVSLRVADDLPYAEVARRLGCSEGAARVRVTRGLARRATALEAT